MKILLKVVLALVFLLVLAVGALLLFFDPNAYKEELVTLARDKGQVVLTLDGDIGWSLYPNLALALPTLSVDDLEGKRMAAVDSAEVSVALLPLLGGRLEMSGLTLSGLTLELSAADADPSAAPAGAAASGAASTSAGAATAPANQGDASQPAAKPLELDIARITIRDANIRYRLPDQTLELSRFNFEGTNIVSGQAFPASSDFALRVLSPRGDTQLSVDAALTAEVLLDLAAQRYGASGLAMKLNLGGAAFGGNTLPLLLGGDLLAELAGDQASVRKLQLDLAGMQLRGELEVTQLSGQPVIAGMLRAAPFDLNQLLQALGQPAVVTSDSQALSRVGFEATLSGPANTVGLKPLKLQLDDTRFEGELALDLATGRQRVRLQGDSLNVDRYLPPPAAAEGDNNQPAKSSTAQSGSTNGGSTGGVAGGNQAASAPSPYSKEPLLPLEVLRALNFDLGIGLKEMIVAGIKVTQLKASATARDGLIRADKLQGQLYGGGFDNSAVIDASTAPLRTDVRKKISGIQLGGLLKDLAQIDNFSGSFSMEGRYQTSGNSVHAVVNSLTGNSVISLKDGRVSGVNLIDNLCQGIRQVKGLPDSGDTAADYTEFSNLGATLKVTNGVVDTRDLNASLVAVGLGGAGQVNLPQQSLDMALDLTVLQQLQGESCQIEEKLHNLAFPVRCKGGFFDEPTKLCRPDTARMKKVLSELTKREAGDKLQKKLDEKLKDNDEVKSLIKGLFK
ncbi:AsmA family protein [Motiliproteus sediminis]|uniref:AsmA family protein n=1 Tax=Motiliproteus sediminis TaxID=1468178 RepID=UPI001AEF64C5|nr:AsmA family protein [Motiliproteus sediminis]